LFCFSFGLLFNAQDNNGNPPFRTSREEIPEVVPRAPQKALYTGRVLKSVEEERGLPINEIANPPVLSEKEIVPSVVVKKTIEEKKRSLEEDSLVMKTTEKKRRMKISEEGNDKAGLVPVENSPVKSSTEVVPRTDPNASYIYCSEARYVAPAITSSGPEVVALLIPASMLNGSSLSHLPGFDNSLLEVSCSVLNLHMWPMPNATNTHH